MYKKYAELRDKYHMTDYYVAEKVGVSRATLSNWKNGKHKISRKTIDKLAKLFKVDVLTFFDD